MKVQIKRNSGGVHIGVQVDEASGYIWFTNNDSSSTPWDEILESSIWKNLEEHVERDRRRLYNLGWKDAKKKEKKKTEFSVCFNSTDYLAW